MKVDTNIKKIRNLLSSRYIEKIFPSKEVLRRILKSGRRLTIYIGIDPTGPKLHLGHSTNFFLLKKFQNLGHKIIFLIGDFTAQIGDPTGKALLRRTMTKKEILENCEGYKAQTEKILDFKSKENPVEIKFNSKWLSKLTLANVLDLAAKTTVGKMIKRNMFQERIKKKKEIYLHEFLYPLLQGYDSVAMNADIEIGGNDQTFNMLVGKDLVKAYQKREKLVITTKLLINPKTQRKLMSKSEGSFVALDEKPNEMYGKIMSLPDKVIISCLNLCTETPDEEVKKIKKSLRKKVKYLEVKASLAEDIVSIYHGDNKAKIAQKEFNRVFKEKKLPSAPPIFIVPHKFYSLTTLLFDLNLAKSKSEAKRLILQGGVKIDGKVMRDWQERIKIEDDMFVQVGKRRLVKIFTK